MNMCGLKSRFHISLRQDLGLSSCPLIRITITKQGLAHRLLSLISVLYTICSIVSHISTGINCANTNHIKDIEKTQSAYVFSHLYCRSKLIRCEFSIATRHIWSPYISVMHMHFRRMPCASAILACNYVVQRWQLRNITMSDLDSLHFIHPYVCIGCHYCIHTVRLAVSCAFSVNPKIFHLELCNGKLGEWLLAQLLVSVASLVCCYVYD